MVEVKGFFVRKIWYTLHIEQGNIVIYAQFTSYFSSSPPPPLSVFVYARVIYHKNFHALQHTRFYQIIIFPVATLP